MKKRPVKHSSRSTAMRFRQSLFWDVDPKTIDPQKHARYVIERVMQLGNDREVRWMWRTYAPARLREVARGSRALDQETKALWVAMTK